MSNLRTVASILVVCSVSLLTGFLIFPAIASGQYQYSAYVAALINQYEMGKKWASQEPDVRGTNFAEISLGVQMQNESRNRIAQFLSRFNQLVRKNPSRCQEGESYYQDLSQKTDIIAVRSLYTDFRRFCRR